MQSEGSKYVMTLCCSVKLSRSLRYYATYCISVLWSFGYKWRYSLNTKFQTVYATLFMTFKHWSVTKKLFFSRPGQNTGKNKLFVRPTAARIRTPSTEPPYVSFPHKYQTTSLFLQSTRWGALPVCVINSRPQNLVKKHLEEFCNFEARGPTVCSSNEYRASATLWGRLKNQTTSWM